MKELLKRVAARLPRGWQQEMKRVHFRRALARGNFSAGEVEYDHLGEWVSAGDWVLDVGANIGQYTARLSQLVGPSGRVIAFEPVPETFELLSANIATLPLHNVTLINAAISERTSLVGMSIPKFESGLENYYMAQLTDAPAELSVLTLTVDSLALPHRIALVKIDAEGHEQSVLNGMIELLRRDKPLLIVEDNDPGVDRFLAAAGFTGEKLPGSSNRIYRDAAR